MLKFLGLGKKDTSKNKIQNYDEIKKKSLKSGKLFCDDYFKLDVKGAEWLRPKQIVDDPEFFVDGASRFDVVQGANAGCWLLVAMANLTTIPPLFDKVVPKDQSFSKDNYAGIFRFNIWQCGTWTEIVVDDRLPVKNGKLMFCHSKEKNEFWSALLEKAYAKIYGSYDELTTGWFTEGIVDFTGGIVERVSVSVPPEELKKVFKASFERNSFICVFMINDPEIHELILDNGLVKGHAYGLTKVQTVHSGGESVFLLRLRNPWGKIEWKGPWSDESDEWQSIPAEEKKAIGLVVDQDGEFWMPLSDFMKNFEYMDICHLYPDMFGTSRITYECHAFKGEWTKGVTAGGIAMETFHLNPQYRLTLTDSDDDADNLCSVLIGLLQKNKSRKTWHKIGITAFRLEGPEKDAKEPLSSEYICDNFHNSISSEFIERRENVVRDKWEPGEYCIIPHTYTPGQEGQYYLRVFSEAQKGATAEESEPSDQIGSMLREEYFKDNTGNAYLLRKGKFLQRNDEEMTRFFQEIAGDANEIDSEGLQTVLEYALTKPEPEPGFFKKVLYFADYWITELAGFNKPKDYVFGKSECRKMIAVMDVDDSGRMDLDEFEVLWRKLCSWEDVFLKYCDSSLHLNVELATPAILAVDRHVKRSDISRLVRWYAEEDGSFGFDDFVLCAVDILGGTS